VTDETWIAYGVAVDMLGGDEPVLRALRGDKIKSRGTCFSRTKGHDEVKTIPADLWGEWAFLPTFKGQLSEARRALCWLVPPGAELSGVCRGFGDLRLLRADVERLAASIKGQPAVEAKPSPGADGAAETPSDPHAKVRVADVTDFIKSYYARTRQAGGHPNREKARPAAEKHFGRTIVEPTWKTAFKAAGIVNRGGRPRKNP
jgi:hypothetical protein